jgi:hypothetical protein
MSGCAAGAAPGAICDWVAESNPPRPTAPSTRPFKIEVNGFFEDTARHFCPWCLALCRKHGLQRHAFGGFFFMSGCAAGAAPGANCGWVAESSHPGRLRRPPLPSKWRGNGFFEDTARHFCPWCLALCRKHGLRRHAFGGFLPRERPWRISLFDFAIRFRYSISLFDFAIRFRYSISLFDFAIRFPAEGTHQRYSFGAHSGFFFMSGCAAGAAPGAICDWVAESTTHPGRLRRPPLPSKWRGNGFSELVNNFFPWLTPIDSPLSCHLLYTILPFSAHHFAKPPLQALSEPLLNT